MYFPPLLFSPAYFTLEDRGRTAAGSSPSFDNGTGIFINQAEIVAADIPGRSARGDEQVLLKFNPHQDDQGFALDCHILCVDFWVAGSF